MKTFKLFEPKPLKLIPPKEEPILRVGIILECDKKRQVFFTPQNDSVLSDSVNQISLTGNTQYSLEIESEKKFLLRDKAGNLVQNFIASGSYESISESISDLIEKNGKITADNIEELADGCKDL